MILMCFMLLSQFIFGSSLVYTSSLKDSVGGYPANNPEFYIADNTVVTNRQQVYVKNSIPKKEKAKPYKKEKTKRDKKKSETRFVKISKSNISVKTSYLSGQIKCNIIDNQFFTISITTIDNFKKKAFAKAAFYCIIVSFIFLMILKKHISYIWGRALLLLIKRNFTRPPPFFILHIIL